MLLDFVVPQPDNDPAIFLQIGCPPLIIFHRIDMLASVQFDSQSGSSARKIHNVRADDQLPGISRSILAKPKPK